MFITILKRGVLIGFLIKGIFFVLFRCKELNGNDEEMMGKEDLKNAQDSLESVSYFLKLAGKNGK